MSDLPYLLSTLRSDLQSLVEFVAFLSFLWFLPACVVSFIAAARTEPTLWRHVPLGIFWGWIAGVLAAAVTGVISLAVAETGLFRENWVTIVIAFGTCGIAAIIANYRAATSYYQNRIKARLGWQITDPPLQPANRWYSFSLRKLLLSQVILLSVMGLWLAVRRGEIHRRRKSADDLAKLIAKADAEKAYRARLLSRFGGHWQHINAGSDGLSLRLSSQTKQPGFQEEVLSRFEPQDRLYEIMIGSDQLTDAGLEILSRNEELKHVVIESNQVTDAGLAHLKKLKKLEWLNLTCSQVTEQGMDDLKSLENLKFLAIYHSKIPFERGKEFQESRPGVQVFVIPLRSDPPVPQRQPATHPL